jgi:TolB-like protein/tetratricopeptide (TPR) repeat protein
MVAVLTRMKHHAMYLALACAGLALVPLAVNAASSPPAVSLAVLPFANASGDASQEPFADGMTDEISATLAKTEGLHVGARVSAFRFKGQAADSRTLGQALGANHLVEGSLWHSGTRILITARLINADDGQQLWAQDYDKPFSGIFDIEDDITHHIATALNVPVRLQPGDKLVPDRTANMAAYENYVRAKPLIRTRGQKPFADAAVLLQDAVAGDPGFAPAAALLAFDYDLAPLYQQALRSSAAAEARLFVESIVPKAEILARRATELSPKSADAFVALAYAQMVQGRLLQADGLFQRALALDPNNTDGLHGYSQLLAAMGRVKDSIAMRQKLQALEPFVINYVADTAEIIWLDGDNDTAIRMLNDFRPGRTSELAQVHASLGHYRQAASVLREMNAANYLPGVLESAAKILEAAPAKTAPPDSLPRLGALSWVYLYMGAPERVLEYYESNLQAGYFQPISSTWFWHPSYGPVRKTERFRAFARAIGLVDVWRERGWPTVCKPVGTNDFACS